MLRLSMGVSICLLGESAAVSRPAAGQVSGDRSFGTLVNGSEIESCLSATCTIEGGTLNTAASLLLHSFEEFSPAAGQSVLFIDPDVQSILVRVTGGAGSLINGQIATQPGSQADLFLVNPSGISFGPTAQLSIGGSLIASTAQRIDFDNGATLASGQATAPSAELLSISAPIGLGFLSAEGASESVSGGGFVPPSAPITVNGPGHLLTFGAPDVPSAFVNRQFQPPSNLSVQPGEAIALIGNGIDLIGGDLTASGGRVELGSVSSGTVRLNPDLSIDYADVESFADIDLAGRSIVEVSAIAPGQALLRGQNISVTESSAVLAEVLPGPPQPDFNPVSGSPPNSPSAGPSLGLIDIQATETAVISGFSIDPATPPFHSYLSVDTSPGAAGMGGSINLQARNLRIESGGQLGANTFGAGDGGQLNLQVAEQALLSGVSPLGPSGLFTTADALSLGNSGQLSITAGHLIMTGGAQIFANSFNQGVAGSIDISANRVSLTGTSDPIVLPDSPSPGSPNSPTGPPDSPLASPDSLAAVPAVPNAPSPIPNSGDTSLASSSTSPDSVLLDGLANDPISQSPSDLPTIEPTAEDTAPQVFVTPTLIQSGMSPEALGEGGGITIEANQIDVTEGAEISTGTFGPGNAGPLNITANELIVSGFSPLEGPSGLFTAVNFGASGNGGTLTLNATQLQVQNGAQIATSTAGTGRAGDLQVNSDSVQLIGQTPQGRSGLFATAIGDTGAGGNLSVNANTLLVDAGATVSVSNFPSGEDTPIPPGQGASGNLQVIAEQITLRDDSSLSADTVAGDRGNIALQTDLLTLRDGSRITTNATGTATGGNIDIQATDFVVAVPTENSDITANAVFGDGGQVNISTRQVLGLSVRPALTPQSDITASSEFGVAGETRLDTIDSDVRPTDQPLPQSTEVAVVLEGCTPGSASTGRFVQTGTGGLSTSPYGVLNSRESLSDVSVPRSLLPLPPTQSNAQTAS
ncbi:MAG: filamentous hemagglutinin N-terminal domain-containing protein, partial [Cyanobacteria bacterium J06614_10]